MDPLSWVAFKRCGVALELAGDSTDALRSAAAVDFKAMEVDAEKAMAVGCGAD